MIQPLLKAISTKLEIHSSIFDIPYLITLIIILLICFIAGWIASLGLAESIVNWTRMIF